MEKTELEAISKWRDGEVKAGRLRIGAACGLILAPRGEGGVFEPYLSALQSCHSCINSDIKKSPKLVETSFEVNMENAAVQEGFTYGHYTSIYYVWKTWLQYLFNLSPFTQVFSSARGLTDILCIAHNLIPIDMNKTPANVTMAGMTCVRHLWEKGINEWPKRFCNLSSFIPNRDLSFMLAPYIMPDQNTGYVKFRPIEGNTNHMLFCPAAIGLDYVRHFVNHEWVNVANGTITEGVSYMDGDVQSESRKPRWNVYSLFSDKVIAPSVAMSKLNGEWMALLKGLFVGYENGMARTHFIEKLNKAVPTIPTSLT